MIHVTAHHPTNCRYCRTFLRALDSDDATLALLRRTSVFVANGLDDRDTFLAYSVRGTPHALAVDCRGQRFDLAGDPTVSGLNRVLSVALRTKETR